MRIIFSGLSGASFDSDHAKQLAGGVDLDVGGHGSYRGGRSPKFSSPSLISKVSS